MINRILTLFAAITLFGMFAVQTGCVKEDFDTVPKLEDQSTWVKTVNIAEVKNLFNSPNNSTKTAGLIKKLAPPSFWQKLVANGVVDSSVVFEGYVLSCDSASNFYETVTIMDETGGIDLKINSDNLYSLYALKPGQKVFVKVNDLALDNYHGSYQVGLPYTDLYSSPDSGIITTIKVTGLDLGQLSKTIQRSGVRKSLTPIHVNLNEIKDTLVQRLIKIDSVQFRGDKLTYSETGITTNRILVDSKGNVILLRNSGYAKFAKDSLPKGSGSITGVLGIYNSTYQLYIRDLSDIQFNNTAFADVIPSVTKTISQLKTLCTADLVKITQNVVIEAVVNANDESGNIYKQLFIEDKSGAIEFDVDMTDLNQNYPVGTKIIVNCKGLYVGKYGGIVKLGGLYNGSVGRLSATDFSKCVYTIGTGIEVTPVETSISSLNDNLLGKIVTLSGVQFVKSELGKTFAEAATTNRSIEYVNGGSVIVRTSAYADFASKMLPQGSGKITAVLSKFNSDYQLYIRTYDEVQMQNPRFEIVNPIPNATIDQLKALCTSNLIQINQNIIIQGLVVANDESGNLFKQLFITDETSGIEFKVDVSNLYSKYPVGTRIIINCTGMYVGKYGGVIQLGGLYNGSLGRLSASEFNSKVFIDATGFTVTPVETTITGINDSMIGKLIKLQNVQFVDADLSKKYAESTSLPTNRTLEDAVGNTIIVRTSSYANFAGTTLPSNSGTIVAVLSKYNTDYQLYIRSIGDVTFDQTRMP